MSAELAALKDAVREIGKRHPDGQDRARRLYIQERASALAMQGDVEFKLKTEISTYFGIAYSDVFFAGSAQLGFSIHKDTIFSPQKSDLDVACINSFLFQQAWIDTIDASNAFNDGASFGSMTHTEIAAFKEAIFKRGMIKISNMPKSNLATRWGYFESSMTRKYASQFGSVNFAIYMNEYAFCRKQSASISAMFQK